MRCGFCKRLFKDGEPAVPVMSYVENEKRGGFFSNIANVYIHLSCLVLDAEES